MSGYADLLNNDSGSQLLKVTLDWGAANNNGNLRTATYQNGSAAYPPILTFQQTYGYDGVNRINSVIDTGGWSRGFCSDATGTSG